MMKKEKDPPKYPEIGARLTKFIEASGQPNARQFALRAGLTPQLVSHLAAGNSIPGGETLMALAVAYKDFDSDWLLTGRSRTGTSIKEEPQPTVPPPSAGGAMRVNRDNEGEHYWQGVANERLKRIENLESTIERLWGQNDDLIKKPETSAEAADLRDEADDIMNQYYAEQQARQYRIAAQFNQGSATGRWVQMTPAA